MLSPAATTTSIGAHADPTSLGAGDAAVVVLLVSVGEPTIVAVEVMVEPAVL